MTQETTPYSGPERVFSGVQPTGNLHLGNYLGALLKFVQLQDSHDCVFCVVDQHSITVTPNHGPGALKSQTRQIAAAFLAAGVDPERAVIFVQSSVLAHTELAWYFNCVARMGWLERMTQFKEKAGKDKERASVGIFDYPVLQAADILAYKATHVPVGEDQKQHLELSRDIADRFNREYDVPGFFPMPEPLIQGPGARIMSLKDGSKKMSKSDPSDLSRINLTDDADTMAKKIKKAKTDSEPLPDNTDALQGRPEVQNLVGIYAALKGCSDQDVLNEYGGEGFGKFKPALADVVVESLAPVTARYNDWLANPDAIDAVLAKGGIKAAEIAAPVMSEVRDIIGFWKSN